MRSNLCKIGRDGMNLADILGEVEKTAVYNDLNDKQALRLRLLAEELIKMIPELLDDYSGSFWVENEARKFELHAQLKSDSMSPDKKGEMISLSKSGKNAAASGILGMIRSAVEDWILYADNANMPMPVGFSDCCPEYSCAWSMNMYMRQMEDMEKKQPWDGLEKSIIASFSDNVIVGIKGKKIEMIVVKKFGKGKD